MRPIRIDFKENKVIMTRKFARAASEPYTPEYLMLQDVKNTYPHIKITMHEITENKDKQSYKGLTYDYMKKYIRHREETEKAEDVIAELEEMILISQCQAKANRYPVIKKWFLNRYTEVRDFGIKPIFEEVEERKTISSIPENSTSVDVQKII